jgi:hypothetical protein
MKANECPTGPRNNYLGHMHEEEKKNWTQKNIMREHFMWLIIQRIIINHFQTSSHRIELICELMNAQLVCPMLLDGSTHKNLLKRQLCLTVSLVEDGRVDDIFSARPLWGHAAA